MEKNFEEKKPIKATIISKCKGGFICDYDSVLAFLPGSQVDMRPLKNIDHLKPENSVIQRATSSDSASGISNGVLLVSATTEIKNIKKAVNAKGL